MIALFEKELMRMEKEVRDLKTAHQRGLGTTRFYEYEKQINVSQGTSYSFTATVADGEPERPAVMVLMNVNEPILGAGLRYLSIGTTNIRFSIFSGLQISSNTRMTVRLISSSKIGEFAQS